MPEQSDSCKRAAMAAMEVVQEECGPGGMTVKEIDGGMFMEIPEEAAEGLENAGNSPVNLAGFEDVIRDFPYVRDWLAGRAAVDADPDSEAFAATVYQLADQITDDPLDFTPSDLAGSEALQRITDAA